MENVSLTVKRSLIGQKFGRLTVCEQLKQPGKDRRSFLLCLCDCSEFCLVQRSNIVGGSTQSCGCLQKELVAKRALKHGATVGRRGSNTYRIWRAMKDRCSNPNNKAWIYYGGSGITVCERWIHSFQNFLEDMGERPNGLSIDRINNSLGYAPGNCRWADWRTQNLNKRKRNSVVKL